MNFRYELRVRYLPKSFHDLLAKDRVTFYYFYDQVSHVRITWGGHVVGFLPGLP